MQHKNVAYKLIDLSQITVYFSEEAFVCASVCILDFALIFSDGCMSRISLYGQSGLLTIELFKYLAGTL